LTEEINTAAHSWHNGISLI